MSDANAPRIALLGVPIEIGASQLGKLLRVVRGENEPHGTQLERYGASALRCAATSSRMPLSAKPSSAG